MPNWSGTYATPRADLGEAYKEYMEEPGTFIGTLVAPELPVEQQKANYPARTRESILKSAETKRQAGGGYNRISLVAEDKSYACEEYGLEGPVDHRKRSFYRSDFDLEMATLEELIFKMKLDREKRIKDAIFNTTTWTGTALFANNSSAPWSTASTDVIGQVQDGKKKVWENTGMRANALVISYVTLLNLLKNADIKTKHFAGQPVLTEDMILRNVAAIFGLEKLIVAKSVEDSADEGQDSSVAEVWSKKYAMICRVAEQNAPVGVPCIARSPRWTVESQEELVVEQYYEPQTRQDVLRARNDVDEVVQDKYMGHLLQIEV